MIRKKNKGIQLDKLDKSNYVESLEPAFHSCKSAIVFESSDFFVPYQSVVLQSLINHCSDNNYYDIIILTDEIDSYDCNLLEKIVADKNNVSLRFYDPTSYVRKYIERSRYKYLPINYYRLALPWILSQYDRALNLGADIVIQKDVFELLECPMKIDEYIAGVIDLGYLGRLEMDIPRKELDLKSVNGYVNADVLVFNLQSIRQDFSMEEVMLLWQKYYFRCAEQDAFNVLFDGHIHHLDLRWNFFPPKMASVEHIAHNTKDKIELWKNSLKEPWIIHFAAYPKPWDYPLVGFGDRWWQYARMSPYYEEILRRLAIVSIRSELGIGRLWVQKLGDRLENIFPRGSKFREFCKKVYATFFTPPNKEWGQKFGKLRKL